MTKSKAKFDASTPKKVTKAFRFLGVERKVGETFPREDEDIAPVFIRRLYNVRKLVDIIEEELQIEESVELSESELESEVLAVEPEPVKKKQTRKRAPRKTKKVETNEADDLEDEGSAPWES